MTAFEFDVAEPPIAKPPASWVWNFDAPLTGLAFGHSGRYLTATFGDGSLQLISRTKLSATPRCILAHTGAALCLQAVPGADRFLSGGDDGRLVETTADGACRELLHAPGQWIDTVAAAENRSAVAIGREVRLLDANGAEIGRTADHPSTVSGLAFNPKGKRVAVSHYDGVTLWWTSTFGGTPTRYRWRGSHIGITWSPDGKFLITATQENELHGWRLSDGADMRMSGYPAKIRSFAWIAKPPHLVNAGSDSVTAWPFAGGGPMGKDASEFGKRPECLVTTVGAHPKRPLVAFGYDDGEVRVAEIPDGRMVGVFRDKRQGRMANIAWSPDGRAIGVGTEGGSVALIDLSRGSV